MPSVQSLLLVGSLPLNGPQDVFEAGAGALGDLLARMPDGETGERATWIAWQRAPFAAVTQLEPTAGREREYQLFPPFRLKAGARADDIVFAALGFHEQAVRSYALFKRLKQQGIVPAHMRFQVCLPTPFAPTYSFVAYDSQNAVYPRYEAALLAELVAITSAIPADELAIQWDVATEMSIWEGLYPVPFEEARAEMIRRLVRLGEAVPAAVELGYHLCYGSMNNRHWKEPSDTGKLVEVANLLFASVPRPIDWLHLPVPIERSDDAYFAPLQGLEIADASTLYLGLLHLQDGVDGALARAEAARRHVRRFGIAAECGLGRWTSEAVPAWLQLHREAALAMA